MTTLTLRRSQGFSLIELMVTLLIGLIVLSGVLKIVINSKRSYLDNQAVSQIQENARYALDTLTRDIRMAGYFGCAPLDDGAINTKNVNGVSGFLVNAGQGISPLVGFDDGKDFPDQFKDNANGPTADAIIVRRVDVEKEYRVVNSPVVSKKVEIQGLADFAAGLPMALISASCQDGLLFNAGTSNKDNTAKTTTLGGLPSNSAALKNFVAGSRLAPVVSHAYFIGESKQVVGAPTLMREEIVGGTSMTNYDELAIGIEDLQFEYGSLSAGAVTYLSATADNLSTNPKLASDAVAVRIQLVMRSLTPVHDKETTITLLGKTYKDRYLRQLATATVQIRNRG